jgi:hypothetical protein
VGKEIVFFFEAYCRTFYGFFFTIYSFAVIFLTGITFLVKEKAKGESYNLLYVFNTMYAWFSLIVLMFYVLELFLAWYGQNPYEWYAFTDQSAPSNLKWFYLKFLFVSIVPFIFFIRKIRINRRITIVVLIITHANYLLAYIERFFIDYLPSSWSTYYEDSFLEKIALTFCFLVLFASVYWVAVKRKKLPYPSLILTTRV